MNILLLKLRQVASWRPAYLYCEDSLCSSLILIILTLQNFKKLRFTFI